MQNPQVQAQPVQMTEEQIQQKKKTSKIIIGVVIAAVVLFIILPILAAMLIPSFLAYTENSNKKTFVEACGTIKTSVLSEMTDEYAENGKYPNQYNIDWDRISDLVGKEVSNTSSADYTVSFSANKGTLYSMTITDGTYTGTWDGSSWTVS